MNPGDPHPWPPPAAAILVGGLGTRLRAATGGAQKVIAPVAGKPFLFRLLDQLADAGLDRVVLCAGHRADDVAATVGTAYRSLRVEYSEEKAPLGTGGALRFALPLLRADPVLAMNGDSFCEVDFLSFRAAHAASGASATLVVREVEDPSRSGRVEFGEDGRIRRFVEKAPGNGRGWINAGVYLLGRAMLESIPERRAVSLEREIFPAWVGRGLCAFPTEGKFLDIGTPESYVAAQSFFP